MSPPPSITRPTRPLPHQIAALPDHTGGTGPITGFLWEAIGKHLFRISFHNWYRLRARLLRLFGASIHPTSRIRPTVRITRPWNLTVGAHTAIGDHAIVFCLGKITIGERCVISQYTHLCAAGHNYTARDMPTIVDPIMIGSDVWLAADTFVGPGVTIGEGSVVGARSTVTRSLAAGKICAGDRAVALSDRQIRRGTPLAKAVPNP